MRYVFAALLLAFAAPAAASDSDSDSDSRSAPRLPRPTDAIQHIVVVMMENRSFDHVLGWHPTADAIQEGLSYTDDNGMTFSTYPLTDYQGCGFNDPDHSWLGSREAFNGGAMDGFLRAGDNDIYAIGYYDEADRPFFNALAREYTTLDRFFSSVLGPTFPNRIFLHAAQTDRLTNTAEISTLPTIWDRLAARAVSGRYYVSDLSFLALWGTKYLPITRPYAQFLADADAGTLPSVSFVEPRFLGAEIGLFCQSDHPFCDIRAGDEFLAETFQAVASSPKWANTVFIVTYDEGGGFFDHVAPPRAAAPNRVDPDIVRGKSRLGFRVPSIVASPFSKGDPSNPRVVSQVFDFASILKLIEWRFGLRPLTARDRSNDIGNLVEALNLSQPDATVPALPLPAVSAAVSCTP